MFLVIIVLGSILVLTYKPTSNQNQDDRYWLYIGNVETKVSDELQNYIDISVQEKYTDGTKVHLFVTAMWRADMDFGLTDVNLVMYTKQRSFMMGPNNLKNATVDVFLTAYKDGLMFLPSGIIDSTTVVIPQIGNVNNHITGSYTIPDINCKGMP
jgi:hypothetical protein